MDGSPPHAHPQLPVGPMRGCCPGTVVLCVPWEQVLATCNVTNPSAPARGRWSRHRDNIDSELSKHRRQKQVCFHPEWFEPAVILN